MEIDLEWSNHFLIGVDEIDAQHKRLLTIMKNVFALKNQPLSSLKLQMALEELKQYARFHFQCEEMLMEIYSYPECGAQKEEHKEIYSKLESKIEMAETGNDISLLLYFLVEWFVGHTRDADRMMGKHICESRNG